MKKVKKALIAGSVLIVVPVYTLLVLSTSDRPGATTFRTFQQPDEIDYESFDPYEVAITEGSIQWSTVGWPRSILIKVTRSGETSYGHFIETNLCVEDATKITSEWDDTGVTLQFATGHRLTIPKEAFIGGR